jgi:hypothetical protein
MLPRSFLFLVSAAALAAVTLTGCQSTTYEGAMVAQKIDSPFAPNATIHLNQVVILDRELQDIPGSMNKAGKITLERHGGVKQPTGAMEVYATFRNRTNYPLQLECRTQFFGAQQEPVEGASAWQRISLPPLGVETFRGLSLGLNNIAAYYVEVREAR